MRMTCYKSLLTFVALIMMGPFALAQKSPALQQTVSLINEVSNSNQSDSVRVEQILQIIESTDLIPETSDTATFSPKAARDLVHVWMKSKLGRKIIKMTDNGDSMALIMQTAWGLDVVEYCASFGRRSLNECLDLRKEDGHEVEAMRKYLLLESLVGKISYCSLTNKNIELDVFAKFLFYQAEFFEAANNRKVNPILAQFEACPNSSALAAYQTYRAKRIQEFKDRGCDQPEDHMRRCRFLGIF
jgi:hypothetical protein